MYKVIFITAVHSTNLTINNFKIIQSNSLTNCLQINVTLDLLMHMLPFQNQVVFLFGRCWTFITNSSNHN